MINHPPFLKNAELNRKLLEDGYVTLPFLRQTEIDELVKLFYQYHTDDEVSGLYVTASHKNDETIRLISDSIKSTFERAILENIANGATLGGTFISKPAHQTEALEPHQDWSIVDESKYRSFTIWVPLSDVDEASGCMYVLPGSHNKMRGYRHLTIPSIFGQIYTHVWQHMKPVCLKAGEAIIFDHALGHASRPNKSDKTRIAATHSLLSDNAEMRFYWNNAGVVEEYLGESDFYNTEEAKSGPGRLSKIRDLDFKMEQLNPLTLTRLYGSHQLNRANVSMESGRFGLLLLVKTLKSLFN